MFPKKEGRISRKQPYEIEMEDFLMENFKQLS
jgi:hypothetical protein